MGFDSANLARQDVVRYQSAVDNWSVESPHARCIPVDFQALVWHKNIRTNMPTFSFVQSQSESDQLKLSMLEYLVLTSYHHAQDATHQPVYKAIGGMVASFIQDHGLPLDALVAADTVAEGSAQASIDAWVMERQRVQWLFQMSVWSGIFEKHLLQPLFAVTDQSTKKVVKKIFTDRRGQVDTGLCSGHSLLSTVACTGPVQGRASATTALLKCLHAQKRDDMHCIRFSTNSLREIDFYKVTLTDGSQKDFLLAALDGIYTSVSQEVESFAGKMYADFTQYAGPIDASKMAAIHEAVTSTYPHRSIASGSPPRPGQGWKSTPSTPGSVKSLGIFDERSSLLSGSGQDVGQKPCCTLL